jgi:hypothetical protein
MKELLTYVSFFISSLLLIELLYWKILIFIKVVLIQCLGTGSDNLALREIENREFSISRRLMGTARLLLITGVLWAIEQMLNN